MTRLHWRPNHLQAAGPGRNQIGALLRQQRGTVVMSCLYSEKSASTRNLRSRGQTQQTLNGRGATLVEAAVVVMVLFTLILGIVEFGIIGLRYHTITTAAREGARFGTAPCQSGDTGQDSCTYVAPDGTSSQAYISGTMPPDSAITLYVTTYLKAGGVPVDAKSVQVTHEWQYMSGVANGESFTVQRRYVKVTVNTNYKFLFFPFGTVPLSATAEMKSEIDILV